MAIEVPSPTSTVQSVVIGSSPIPTILGYVGGAATIAEELLTSQGVPSDWRGWLQVLAGIGIALFGRYVKQSNVSNAAAPVAAQTIKEMPAETGKSL